MIAQVDQAVVDNDDVLSYEDSKDLARNGGDEQRRELAARQFLGSSSVRVLP